MKESNPKVADRNTLPKQVAGRPSSTEYALSAAAPVTDASSEWKKYRDGRLRHFATGR